MFKTKHSSEFTTSYEIRPIDLKKFMDKVRPNGSCWYWEGRMHRGYGAFCFNGSSQWAHRVSFFIFKGEIPGGHVVDHICRNPACVNPDHLKAVTLSGNAQLAGWRVRDELNERLPFT